MIFWIGIYPKTFIDKIEPSVNKVIETVKSRADTGDDLKDTNFVPVNPEDNPDNISEEPWDSTGQ